jgi:hypothetical protein
MENHIMQLQLFSTNPTATLSVPPVPPAPKPARKPRKRKQLDLSVMTTDQLIDQATCYYGVLLNFNAKPDQPSKEYVEAQQRFNEVFAVLSLKFSPTQIISFCMEDLTERIK